MGGYGALRFAFLYPQLFGSVSAHSAALVAKLPVSASLHSPQATSLAAMGIGLWHSLRSRILGPQQSVHAGRNGARPMGIKIYFDCGTEDQFGFDVGAQAFHELLDAKKIPHEFHLYPGGHDWSYFAEHFPASLEFHSRAFGLPTGGK